MPVFSNKGAQAIIDQLNAVDFSRSRLPREILEDHTPGIPFCKLEYSTKVRLVKRLTLCRLPDDVDISPLDKRLLNLAGRFEGYVRAGDLVSTIMTHDALVRGIHDIRCNFPKNPAVPPEDFIRINADYLDQWIVLIQFAEIYDRQVKGLARQRQENQKQLEEVNKSIDNLCTRVATDPDFGDAFFHILDHDRLEERIHWTPAQREVHTMLVDHRLEQVTLQMSNLQLNALEQNQLTIKQKIDTLRVQLTDVPIVTDPELMNKYRDAMKSFLRNVEASDAFFNETFEQMRKYEDTLQRLGESDSATRQNIAAADGARTTIEKLNQLNQTRST